ncbi:MAG: hypothetical protein IJC17_04480 [Clostridia bacterium]|nr:hypothetical protein [Clostridia bacterium]
MKRPFLFFLAIAVLLCGSGCRPSEPSIVQTSSTTASTTTNNDYAQLESFINGLLTLPSDSSDSLPDFSATTTAASTTRATSKATTSQQTTTATSSVLKSTTASTSKRTSATTTTSSTVVKTVTTPTASLKQRLGSYALLAKPLGVFDSVDALSTETVASFLFNYVRTQADEYASLMEFDANHNHVRTRIPMNIADNICRQFFGRTYDFNGVSCALEGQSVQATGTADALTFDILFAYGNGRETLYMSHSVAGDRYTLTVCDFLELPAGDSSVNVTVDGRPGYMFAKYSLKLQKTATGFSYLSCSEIDS